MKKTLALLLAIVMIFALAAPVMADTTTATTGSITIENAVPGQTYKLYRMFDLESYNTATNSFVYTVAPGWEDFYQISGVAAYLEYVESGDKLYVKWIAEADADTEAFAKLAREFVTNQRISYSDNCPEPCAEKTADGDTVVFDNLPLGYYLVDSSLGLLCSLNTTKPDATVIEKNSAPTIAKKVFDGENWVDSISAMPGEELNFKIEVTVGKGAQEYKIHDWMDPGLKLGEIKSVKVNGTTVPERYYKLTTDQNKLCETCKKAASAFEIRFIDATWDTASNQDLSLKVKPGDVITVEYTAICNLDNDEAKNHVYLSYGDDQKTPEDDVIVKNFGFILIKWDGRYAIEKANLDSALLLTAQFKLTDADGEIISFVKPDQDEIDSCWGDQRENGYETLRYSVWNESVNAEEEKTDIITAGWAEISGLKAGTYYLEEIAAPENFNKIEGKMTLIIDNDGNVTLDGNAPSEALEGSLVVINNGGAELPSTGGIGTTIFYIVGGLLMVGAAVVLVTRKKVSADK